MDPLQKFKQQPYIGFTTVGVGLLTLAATWAVAVHTGSLTIDLRQEVLTVALIVATIVAYKFPIYVRHKTKIVVFSIPLFLMAALLVAPLAGTAAFVSILGGELAVRKQRGTSVGTIATSVGRWVVLVIVAAYVGHLQAQLSARLAFDLQLVGAAAVLWTGDLLTLPLALCPICHERASRVIVTATREGGAAEAAQYVVGLLGVFLATQQVWALAMLVLPGALVYMAFKKEMDPDTFELLESMADNIDLRGACTEGHSRRVAELVGAMLVELGMQGQEARHIAIAARLHDIGKSGLPDQLLISPAPLTPEDRALLDSYPERGAEMLSAYSDFSRGIEMVRHHHERWDGNGYPSGLAGTDIPFGARVIALADSYDAMTSSRPFRPALTPDQAAQILLDGSGRQWDPELVTVFLRTISDRLEHPILETPVPALLEAPLPVAQRATA